MDRCIKCHGETINQKLFPCDAKICLTCGYVELYTTKEDLAKFNEKRGKDE